MAGRPRKSQSVSNGENVSSDTTAVSNELLQNLMNEIANLKKQLEEKDNKETFVEAAKIVVAPVEEDDFDKIEISQDSYIKVISLTPYTLNLSTEGRGRGRLYVFHGFGDTKRIIYSDLVKILEVNHHFINEGFCFIADRRVIRRHGLDDVYSKILTKEMIESIVNGSANDAVSLFKSCNEKQQGLIVEMLLEKLQNNPDSVDLNLVDKISRASGVKIQEKAEEARQLQKIASEESVQ